MTRDTKWCTRTAVDTSETLEKSVHSSRTILKRLATNQRPSASRIKYGSTSHSPCRSSLDGFTVCNTTNRPAQTWWSISEQMLYTISVMHMTVWKSNIVAVDMERDLFYRQAYATHLHEHHERTYPACTRSFMKQKSRSDNKRLGRPVRYPQMRGCIFYFACRDAGTPTVQFTERRIWRNSQ